MAKIKLIYDFGFTIDDFFVQSNHGAIQQKNGEAIETGFSL
jgi:hypothetical protein